MRLVDADEFENRCMFSKDISKYVNDDALFLIIAELDKTPTVDAEPIRHGHWAKIEISGIYDCQNTMPIYKCSFCHTPFVNVDLKDRFHYCPNCGALMDEVEEDEERRNEKRR